MREFEAPQFFHCQGKGANPCERVKDTEWWPIFHEILQLVEVFNVWLQAAFAYIQILWPHNGPLVPCQDI